MPLPSEFWEQLPHMADTELCDMLAHKDDYEPEALAAAAEELRKRKVAPERLAQLETAVRSIDAAAEAKAQERLSWPARFLIVLFCLGLSGILLACYYHIEGYKRKARDCWITVAVTIGAVLLLGGFLALIR